MNDNVIEITKIPTVVLILYTIICGIYIAIWIFFNPITSDNTITFLRIGILLSSVILPILTISLFKAWRRGFVDVYTIEKEIRRTLPDRQLITMDEVDCICVLKEKYPNQQFLPARDVILICLKSGKEVKIWVAQQKIPTGAIVSRLVYALSKQGFDPCVKLSKDIVS